MEHGTWDIRHRVMVNPKMKRPAKSFCFWSSRARSTVDYLAFCIVTSISGILLIAISVIGHCRCHDDDDFYPLAPCSSVRSCLDGRCRVPHFRSCKLTLVRWKLVMDSTLLFSPWREGVEDNYCDCSCSKLLPLSVLSYYSSWVWVSTFLSGSIFDNDTMPIYELSRPAPTYISSCQLSVSSAAWPSSPPMWAMHALARLHSNFSPFASPDLMHAYSKLLSSSFGSLAV